MDNLIEVMLAEKNEESPPPVSPPPTHTLCSHYLHLPIVIEAQEPVFHPCCVVDLLVLLVGLVQVTTAAVSL